MAGVDAAAVEAALRRRRFTVRRETADGTTFLYGDRNRWTKMATLCTHTGLVLFLVAAAVTTRLGDEQGLVVAEGASLTVQPIGTPGLLLVRNLGFDAPGFETGSPTDFTTHLAVYQDGRQIAEKVIRVSDPLGGLTQLQNGRSAPTSPSATRTAAVDGADPDDRRGGRLPVHRVRGSGPRRRPPAPPPAAARRDGRHARRAVPRRRDERRRHASGGRFPAPGPGPRRERDGGRHGLLGGAPRVRGLHAPDRKARSRAGAGVDRVRVADRGTGDHLLVATRLGQLDGDNRSPSCSAPTAA
jgi:hypothetical protein